MQNEKDKQTRYVTYIRGKEVEITKMQHVMKRRFRQKEEYHQNVRKPKMYSLEQAADEMIPIEYQMSQERQSLEEQVLIQLEAERILKIIKEKSIEDYELIYDLYFHEMTEAEAGKIRKISQQAVNDRKKRIIAWVKMKEK